MTEFSSHEFRQDLITIGEQIRDFCAAKVPANLGHYTGSQLRMITRIYELTRQDVDGIQLKKLAQVLNITPAATSEMVETLVKRGALERRVDSNDRRAMALRLTPELNKIFQDSVACLDKRLAEFFTGIAPEKQQIAAEVLHELNLFFATSNGNEIKK